MLKDRDGKTSLSRTSYMATLAVVLYKMIVSGMVYQDIDFGTADLTGMALILAAVAANYYGSEVSKRANNV